MEVSQLSSDLHSTTLQVNQSSPELYNISTSSIQAKSKLAGVRNLFRKKVKITVFKRVDPEVIFDGKVPVSPTGRKYEKCSFLSKGQEFVVDTDLRMPEGFCSWAWHDVFKDVCVLAHGGDYYDWVEKGIMYTCCSDGIRPVSFLLERIEE